MKILTVGFKLGQFASNSLFLYRELKKNLYCFTRNFVLQIVSPQSRKNGAKEKLNGSTTDQHNRRIKISETRFEEFAQAFKVRTQ